MPEPAEIAVITPVAEPTVINGPRPVDHEPPALASLRDTEDPAHNVVVPLIAAGSG